MTYSDRLLDSFARYLRSLNRAKKTIEGYTFAVRRIGTWLTDRDELGDGVDWNTVGRDDLREYIADVVTTTSGTYANNQYRALQQWFGWLARDEEIDANPMAGMRPPKTDPKVTMVLPLEQCRTLVATCKPAKPRDRRRAAGAWDDDLFEARRDEAMLRLWIDTGVRRAEMAGLTVDAVNIDARRATVTGKGSKTRRVRFSAKTGAAIDRYLRVRDRHKLARFSPALWLGIKNRPALTGNGLRQLVARRGLQAGIEDLHPHAFRHTFSHHYRASGGGDDDLMELNGWETRAMLSLYSKSVAAERALNSYDRHSIGDQI